MEFIDIVDETGHKSSLGIGENGKLTVLGVLPHGTVITPVASDDCDKLVEAAMNRERHLAEKDDE